MNNDDKFRSAFRTVELTMSAMIALGAANNVVFWIAFALALILDVFINSFEKKKKIIIKL